MAVELAPEGVDPCIEQVGRFLERLVGFLRQDLEAGARDGVGHSPSEPHGVAMSSSPASTCR